MKNMSSNASLSKLTGFGSNPGALNAWTFLPKDLPDQAPLVVVLHGCTQTAQGYDSGSGWSQLAAEQGFALLYPEQQRANNGNLCFNWFEPGDTKRGQGEPQSIQQMILALVKSRRLDPKRVFITGLSAGGAMAATMLATYPELFAGGAVIAGLPFGIASGVGEAFASMQGRQSPSAEQLQALLREASSHKGPWPSISLWHGTHDHTVKPRNMDLSIEQWRGVHALAEEPTRTEIINGHERKVWASADGKERLETYSISRMAHGVPLSTKGRDILGVESPFMLEAGISSTRQIARFWNIVSIESARESWVLDGEVLAPEDAPSPVRKIAAKAGKAAAPVIGKIEQTINDALKAAGLLR